VYDYAQVYGNAQICNDTFVFGNAKVYGNLKLLGGLFFYTKEKFVEIDKVDIDGNFELLARNPKFTYEKLKTS